MSIPRHQLSVIEKEIVRMSTRREIALPPNSDSDQNQTDILELEAEALMLELELA